MLGKVKEALDMKDRFNRARYQDKDGEKNNLQRGEGSMRYICNLCGWIYDEEETGVAWESLPEDFTCELCGATKYEFTPEE